MPNWVLYDWLAKHRLPIVLAALAAGVALAAAVGLRAVFQPPEAGVVADLDPETRVLSFSPGPGCTIESLSLVDKMTGEWSSFTAPPFQYRVDGPGPLEFDVQYRDRRGEVYSAEGSASISAQSDDGGHSMTVHLAAIGTDGWGNYLIPETDPCPICASQPDRP